ncbi:Copia protein, partial [Mucuna pruriens]
MRYILKNQLVCGVPSLSEKLSKVGLEHQLATLYTPQQNGVSERKNKSIMEMTRCMLHQKELPKKQWVETSNMTILIQNILPTQALQNQTPFEAWFSFKPL